MTLIIDTTPPAAPSAPTLLAADDSGVVGDSITNVRQPRFTGSAVPNSSVQLVNAAGVVVGSVAVGPTGTYTIRPTSPLADGTYAFRVADVDVAGNLSAPGAALSITILGHPAGRLRQAPGCSRSTIRACWATASPPSLSLTWPGRPRSGQPSRSSTRVAPSWGQERPGPIADIRSCHSSLFTPGTYALSAEVVDVAGNVGTPSTPFNLTIQTPLNPPAVPSSPLLLAADDSGVVGDGITNINQPRFTGTATPGTTVQLISTAGAVLGSATVAPNGAYTVAPSVPMADGTYSIQARDVDLSGNIGAPSTPDALTILTILPTAPTTPTLLSTDDSGVQGDGITNVNQPRLIGTAPAGDTVDLVSANGTIQGTSVVTSTGSYALIPSLPLNDGTYALAVEAIDVAGNVSTPSGTLTLTILTSIPAAPTAPVLLAADDSGVKGDSITNVTQPHLTGTAQPGATVQLLNGPGAVLATTTASASGSYTLQPATPLPDGLATLQTRVIDAAGNLSTPNPSLTLSILTAIPAAPGAPMLSVGGGQTYVRRPVLIGTASAGSTANLLDPNGNILASATVPVGGGYSLQPAANLNTGTIGLRVQVQDVAGNVGPVGPAFNLTVVDAPPANFGGGAKSDVAVFRLATAQWIGIDSAGGTFNTGFGDPSQGDVPVPADYDGLGHSELAVYRPSTGQWIISGPTGVRIVQFRRPDAARYRRPGRLRRCGSCRAGRLPTGHRSVAHRRAERAPGRPVRRPDAA